ncbi:MAG TPA: OmpA family protein, partial [Coxiellaceae bacterium]|nr:OmpA family protein [Coxiellaceae bacterium]
LSCLSLLQSCNRSREDVWDDTKSAGRHLKRSAKAMAGYHGDSRQIRCRSDFEGIQDECYAPGGFYQNDYQDPDYQNFDYQQQQPPMYNFLENAQPTCDYGFIPLEDQANDEVAMADYLAQQPRETPGEPGSSIPGIQAFEDPSTIPQLVNIFKTLYFDYDSSLLKGQANLNTIHKIAEYLRSRPHVYVFIEGHTDERGPQAYNLALGSRRANTVRTLLINEGVNPDHLFTISYGKERPTILENNESGWAKNRRVEFKVYAR